MNIVEIEEIKQNDLLVATRGREPGLNLINNRKKISLSNWANQILDEMTSIAGLLDNTTTDFSSIIDKFSNQIADSEQTLSAMLLNKVLTEKIDFLELGRTIGNDYKNYYIGMEVSKNSEWSLLEDESADSLKRQVQLEQDSKQSFKDFAKEYFNE